MRRVVRKRWEMATRVREFCRANPSDDSAHVGALAKLEDRLNRFDALTLDERAGRVAELASANRREELRRTMHFELLRHLVRVGELAAKDHPELAGKFRLRTPNATYRAFLVSSKAMLAEGVANKDLFVSLGLSAAMFEDLGKAVAEFEAATVSGSAGRSGHVGARAELEAVSAELLEFVELHNTFNRYRFRDQPRLAAEWENVCSMFAPFRTRPEPPTPSPGVTPPSGGIAPAA